MIYLIAKQLNFLSLKKGFDADHINPIKFELQVFLLNILFHSFSYIVKNLIKNVLKYF